MIKTIPLLFIFFLTATLSAQPVARIPLIGVVNTLDHDSLLQKAGYRYIITSIGTYISPRTVSDQQFQINLAKFRSLKVQLYAFNIFMPGDLKLVGPDVDEKAIMSYVEAVFRRVQAAGVKMIVWGSGGARRLPDGFDRSRATQQFEMIASKVATLAASYNITLALESLNSSETNFINTAAEAFSIVKTVNHPNLRLNIDIYHMLKENESPEIIITAKDFIVHCEIAEKEHRSPPGIHGTDFRPYLSALRKSGYQGNIFIECDWKNLDLEAASAFQFLEGQIKDVFTD
jgi:sugar phosphate isomerase/epimerase